MGKQNIGARYQSISYDKPFIAAIKNYIKDRKQYRSVADFTREAIREKMESDAMREDMVIMPQDEFKEKHGKTIDKRIKSHPLNASEKIWLDVLGEMNDKLVAMDKKIEALMKKK